MSTPIAPEVRARVALRLRDGASVPEVAAEAEISPASVRRIAAAEGIALRRGRPLGDRSETADRRAEAIGLLAQHDRRTVVCMMAHKYGVTVDGARHWLPVAEKKKRQVS